MEGRVEYFLPEMERNFGFIRYKSDPESDRFDRSIYFHGSELCGDVDRGTPVSFEIHEEGGKTRALGVRPIDDRLSGKVISVSKDFGFILTDCSRERIFFAFDDVRLDCIGRRRALTKGIQVSFQLGPDPKGLANRAVDVVNEDPELANIDVDNYREYAQVEFYNGDRGYVSRSNGDTLPFLRKNFITLGEETVRRGVFLEYGVKTNLWMFDDKAQKFHHRAYAIDISVCIGNPNLRSPQDVDNVEELFLNAPELPLSEPEPERLAAGRCLSAVRKENDAPPTHRKKNRSVVRLSRTRGPRVSCTKHDFKAARETYA